MVSKSFCLVLLIMVLVPNLYVGDARKLQADNAERLETCKFQKIYQFGDSISDTGNLATERPFSPSNRFPYGMTLRKPTGRYSNGLLMVDYFAKAFGVPFLNPYQKVLRGADFKHGVNFAVAGATALPEQSLRANHVRGLSTNASLNVQLQWMQAHLNYACQHKQVDCTSPLKNSLVFLGEIGGSDYNNALLNSNQPMIELDGLIPGVVQTIADGVRTVINLGATNVIVPGIFPIGCVPAYLNRYPREPFDSNQCLAELNKFAVRHNTILQSAIEYLRSEYPSVTIVYADYYNAFLSLLDQAQNLGFKTKLSACCGSGSRSCGMLGVAPCRNPDDHISWDGIHMTQQAYKSMAYYLLKSFTLQLGCRA